jgi:hypothetical protein
MRYLGLILALVVLVACNKEEIFDGPNTYSDGFESYSAIDETIDGNNERWSFFQSTLSDNAINIDSTFSHTGNKCLQFIGSKTTDALSKSSINKQKMAFWDGEVVSVDFWLYLVGKDSLDWLFLFDIEEKTSVGAGPGMRLALVEGKILLEHKYQNPNVRQEGDGVLFPRDQWVNIRFETKLSQQKKGYVKGYQDGQLIIEQDSWKTLPSDFLYATQGTQGRYSQLEFGVTANPTDKDVVMYVDDIEVEVIE